jgi:hypothetical protein
MHKIKECRQACLTPVKKYEFCETTIQYILNRDEPMTREDVIDEFERQVGRAPSEDEIEQMRPDSDSAVRRYLAKGWLRAE